MLLICEDIALAGMNYFAWNESTALWFKKLEYTSSVKTKKKY